MEETKPAAPPVAPRPAASPGIPIQGMGAIAGAVVCVVLNVVTDGWVPGGYAAGVIGGGIGWVIGIGVEKFLASRQKESQLCDKPGPPGRAKARRMGVWSARAVACVAMGLLATGAGAAEPLRTVSAADFVATIGVQVHLNDNAAWGAPQSPYADPVKVERALAYLNPGGAGIRVLRDTAFYARGAGYLPDHASPGRAWLPMGYLYRLRRRPPDWSDQFDVIDELVAAHQVALVEGPLEVDNPGWGLAAKGLRYRTRAGRMETGWAAAIAGQRDLYARFRGRVKVALFSLAEPGDGAADGPAARAAAGLGTRLPALCDWGNVHFYQHDGRAPGSPEGGELRQTIAQETGVVPGAPFAITETGFNTLNVHRRAISARRRSTPSTCSRCCWPGSRPTRR